MKRLLRGAIRLCHNFAERTNNEQLWCEMDVPPRRHFAPAPRCGNYATPGEGFIAMEEVTREEFSQFAARASVVEREVEGEKLVTRYILEQSRRNGDDLAAVKTRLDRVEQRLDGLDQKMNGLDHKFDAFARDYPGTVADIMRAVLQERGEG
jgi:hypothetical protein